MKITTEPRSDQWNADDFVGGPRVFTIAGVRTGTAEQKYDIQLVEGQGRSWRPPLTVLRLLVAGWGDDATQWAGRKVRLYRDPSISFCREKVGGIRVSHMTDLPGGKRLEVKLTETRGKRATHVVEPLTTDDLIATYKAEWKQADPERRTAIEAEVATLTGATPEPTAGGPAQGSDATDAAPEDGQR